MNIAWTDLGGALLWVLGGLAVLAAVVGLLIWSARRRRGGNALVEVAFVLARLWLILCALGAGIIAWRWLSGGDVWIPALPVSLAWPGSLPCEQGVPAQPMGTALWCAHVSVVDATITGLDAGTRTLLALGELLGVVLAASPAVIVAIVCAQALKGRPFSRTVGRWLLIMAAVVLVAGLGADLATGIGRELAAAAVLAAPDSGDPVTTTGYPRLAVSLWPIGAALALGALGAVFRYGAVLQRETEGLV